DGRESGYRMVTAVVALLHREPAGRPGPARRRRGRGPGGGTHRRGTHRAAVVRTAAGAADPGGDPARAAAGGPWASAGDGAAVQRRHHRRARGDRVVDLGPADGRWATGGGAAYPRRVVPLGARAAADVQQRPGRR